MVLSLAAAACGDDDRISIVDSSPDPRHNALVVDDGFDTSAAVFAGRLAGTYTIVCQNAAPLVTAEVAAQVGDGGASASDGGASPGDGGAPPPTLAERKATVIESLRARDDQCHLRPGIAAKPDPLAPIARHRDRWNNVIRGNRFADSTFSAAEIEEIREAQKALGNARFHGTATAGVIAHANPDIRLVLVEEVLGNAEEIMRNFTCIKQEELDDSVAIYSDPQVRQAYIDAPASSLDDDITELFARHHIGLVNESFGYLSRQALERLQEMKGCPPVNLKPYFAQNGELDRARAQARSQPAALLVKSAGNDASQIDGPEDSSMCAMAPAPRLIVGAYDDSGQLAEFTNFGRCVDAVAPGWRVIAPIPGGWVMPMSGTSFSAPLVVRLISMERAPNPFTPEGARTALLAARDGRDRIPIARFPREVLYDPMKNSRNWALTLAGQGTFRSPEPFLVSARQLRELLIRLSRH